MYLFLFVTLQNGFTASSSLSPPSLIRTAKQRLRDKGGEELCLI